jgi:predicted dehydrogenase
MSYRVGIVGSGFGGTVHAPAFALHPEFELVAIASPNSAETLARERGIPHAFASVEAMLVAIGNELDVISVATPPFDHHHSVTAALAAGKHVLCEKPFALTVTQAEEMTAAADRAGVANALAFEFRYGSATQALRELIANGHLTALHEIEVTRFGSELRSGLPRPPSSWWYDRTRGGGVANAFMPHVIDLALYLAGRAPAASYGFLRVAVPQRVAPDGTPFIHDASDGCFAVLDLGDGLAARLTVDATLSLTQATIALHGETRTAVGNGPHLLDLSLFVVDGDDASEYEVKRPPHAQHAAVHPNLPAFLALLDRFAERIATGGGECPTFADGLATQRVLRAIGYEG